MIVGTELREKVESVVESMGYEFVGCEWRQSGRSMLLRIYIDTKTGVTIDDCTSVSRQLSAMFDVEEPMAGQYVLEVSSPGIDRPLFEKKHYQKQIGQRIKLSLHTPLNGRRRFEGVLTRMGDDDVHLLVGALEIVIPFSSIEKANVVADVRF